MSSDHDSMSSWPSSNSRQSGTSSELNFLVGPEDSASNLGVAVGPLGPFGTYPPPTPLPAVLPTPPPLPLGVTAPPMSVRSEFSEASTLGNSSLFAPEKGHTHHQLLKHFSDVVLKEAGGVAQYLRKMMPTPDDRARFGNLFFT